MSGKIVCPSANSLASRRATDIVARAWQRTLGQLPPADDRSFDAVDGDSLRLLQLIFHIERLSGQALPLERFHGEMCPSQFAVELDRLFDDPQTQAGTALPVVYLVPGYGGDEPQLARFRVACSRQIEIRVTSYPPFRRLVRGRFEDIVRHVSGEIERLSPVGAIALAGYSLGGDVAYAVAARLLALGRRVSVLCVLDTDATRTESNEPAQAPVERRNAAARFMQIWRRRHWNELVAALLPVSVIATPLALRVLRSLTAVKLPLPGNLVFFVKWYLRHVLVKNQHMRWANTLPVTGIPVPVVLFRSEEDHRELPHDLGWSARARDLAVVRVRGNHFTMLSPENNTLLRQALVDAVLRASIELPSIEPASGHGSGVTNAEAGPVVLDFARAKGRHDESIAAKAGNMPDAHGSAAALRIIDRIDRMPWEKVGNREVLQVAYAYRYFSIQFRENLEIACRLFPDDLNLKRLFAEECNTDNLSPYPGIAEPGERLDHDEFLDRLLLLQPVDRSEELRRAGADYARRVRSVPGPTRANSLASYEGGGLATVFRAMLRAPQWNGEGQHAFRFFLQQHITFDSNPHGGHGALSRNLRPDETVASLWNAFEDLLLVALPKLSQVPSALRDVRSLG